jgi:hypothetical protein
MYNSDIKTAVIIGHETGKNVFIPRKPVIESVYPLRVRIIKFTMGLNYVMCNNNT